MIINVNTPAVVTGPAAGAIEAAMVARIAAGRLQVPAYPAIAGKLQQLVCQERTGTHHLAAVIKTDPALTALVLARASSAALGMSQTSSLDMAIYRLGGQELVQLAVASTLGSAMTRHGVLAALRRRAWREALIAAGLCEVMSINRRVAHDQAFLAGLLHDFGLLVAISAIEEAPDSLPAMPEADWWALVQRLHVEAGRHVAHAWRLAPGLADAISDHHLPGPDLASRPLVKLVADVDRIIDQLERGADLEGVSADDQALVRSALPRIMEQIAGFEASMPAIAASIAAPSKVARPDPERDGWPVDLEVTSPKGTYRATAIWVDRIAFAGPAPLRPDWIAQLVVTDGGDRLDMFATVKSCEVVHGISHVVARPYALAGADAATWMRIVNRARGPRRGP